MQTIVQALRTYVLPENYRHFLNSYFRRLTCCDFSKKFEPDGVSACRV